MILGACVGMLSSAAQPLGVQSNGMFWISQCCNFTTLPIRCPHTYSQWQLQPTSESLPSTASPVAWNGIHPWRHCIAWDHLGTWMVRIPPRVKGFVQREHLSPQTSVQYPPTEITTPSHHWNTEMLVLLRVVALCCFVVSQQLQSSILYQGSLVSIFRFPLLLFHASQLIQKPASSRNDLLNLLNQFSGNPCGNHPFIPHHLRPLIVPHAMPHSSKPRNVTSNQSSVASFLMHQRPS